jgi:hypothetical protein
MSFMLSSKYKDILSNIDQSLDKIVDSLYNIKIKKYNC